MIKAQLPEFLKHSSADDLVRVGRGNDGGYVVSESDIRNSDILLSLGIGDDWSFEEQFVSIKDVPVLAYDGSVSSRLIRKRYVRSIFHFWKPLKFLYRRRFYKAYSNFFSGTRRHFEKFVGLSTAPNHVSLASILETLTSDNIFLKIDIEGDEYRLLADILANQARLTGLVIEFHDCDLHLERIKDFVSSSKLKLVHIHANNYSPLDKDGLPLVLELTFSSNAEVLTKTATYPHPLDLPNDPQSEDILVCFS